MTERVVNTLGSMFHRKAKPMTEEVSQDQIELPLELEASVEKGGVIDETPPTATMEPEIIGLFIAGQGSDAPELHVRFSGRIFVRPLTNPVTAAEIASILSELN